MALTAVSKQRNQEGRVDVYSGGIGVSDNDVIAEIDARAYHDISFGSLTGAVDVFASLDGTNYLTAPLSLIDMGSTSFNTAVIVSAANRVYRVQGPYYKLRFLQNGATAVTGLSINAHKDLA